MTRLSDHLQLLSEYAKASREFKLIRTVAYPCYLVKVLFLI
jgi:hypothetical protein